MQLVPLRWNSVKASALRLTANWEGSISAKHVLLGDIGATNAKFALLANGALGPVKSFDVASFARFADAAAIFLKDHCRQLEISNAVLAVAGPIEGERCVLTNCSWVIDARELYDAFGLNRTSSTTSRPWPILYRRLPRRIWWEWEAGKQN